MTVGFLYYRARPILKESYLIRKQLLPLGANSFLIEQPIIFGRGKQLFLQKGINNVDRVVSFNCVSTGEQCNDVMNPHNDTRSLLGELREIVLNRDSVSSWYPQLPAST